MSCPGLSHRPSRHGPSSWRSRSCCELCPKIGDGLIRVCAMPTTVSATSLPNAARLDD